MSTMESSMTRHLFQSATASADRLAIVDGENQYTYEELFSASTRVSHELLSGRDDLHEERVAILIPAGFDYVATLSGIWAAGGIAVPLCLNHPLPELDYVVRDTGAKQLVVSEGFRDLADELAESSDISLQFVTAIRGQQAPSHARNPPSVDQFRRALILYTSGSTGRPKGVVTTHRNIAAQVEALVTAWEWSADDRILHVLPLHHIHGIINVLLCAMRVGAVCEFSHPFDPQTVWRKLASGELTLFMAVPTIYAKLIAAFEAADPATQAAWSAGSRGMRLHVSGSAALPVPVLEQWESITGHRLLERYGMTEIGHGAFELLSRRAPSGIRRPAATGSGRPPHGRSRSIGRR